MVFLGTDDWDDADAPSGRRRDRRRSCATGWPSLTNTDPINIQYTSGTTGFPKGATLSHRNILNNGFFVTELINLGPSDRLCIPVPFYHCFGMVMGNLGCTTHGADDGDPGARVRPGSDAGGDRGRAVHRRLRRADDVHRDAGHPDFADRDLSSLRTGIMAGSVCPVEVMKRCVNDMNMAEVSIAYGMTETSPVSCQTLIDDDLERRTATDRPCPSARGDQDRRPRRPATSSSAASPASSARAATR